MTAREPIQSSALKSRLPVKVHSFVQHADYLDQIGLDHAVDKHVHRALPRGFRIAPARETWVETTQSRRQFRPLSYRATVWIVGDLPHRGLQHFGVAPARLRSPPLETNRENIDNVYLGSRREAVIAHAPSAEP